jgi:N-acetylmuramoyl-L-alanine amidase
VNTLLFAPGACESFGPTVGDRHQTVFLDAGHGGLDPGAVGQTPSGLPVHEADITLAVELDAMALLRAEGFAVTVSRTGDSTVARLQPGDTSGQLLTLGGDHRDLVARDLCADLAGANALVGIYFNGGGSPLNAGCITGFDGSRDFGADNFRLALLLQHDVLTGMNAQGWGIPDLGLAPDTALGGAPPSAAAAAYGHLVLLGPADPPYVAEPTQMPGALIEPMYVTDPFEAALAASVQGQQVMAAGIASAVEAYFGAAPPASQG